MNKETVTNISYQVVLNHPPVVTPKAVQHELIAEIAKSIDYTSSFYGEAAFGFDKSCPNSNEKLSCRFTPNQIIIIHDYPSQDDSLKIFSKKVSEISQRAIEKCKIPIFFAQNYILRAHAKPLNITDARVFIGDKVLNLTPEKRNELNRPIHTIGFRLFFPMLQDTPYSFDVRVESLVSDPTTIFLENLGECVTPLTPQQIAADEIENRMKINRAFLNDNICTFLEKFNNPKAGS